MSMKSQGTRNTLNGLSLREYVAKYKLWDLCVIPIIYKDKKPTIPWAPYQKRKPDEAELSNWFSGNTSNVAIVCGGVSGNFVVLDFDNADLYSAFSEYWQQFYGKPIQEMTPIVQTGGGGWHVYLKAKQKPPLYHPVKEERKHIPDIQSEGGYVLAPPSIHPSGKPYKFLNPEVKTIHEVNSLSELAIDIPDKGGVAPSERGKQPNWVTEALGGVEEGSRDQIGIKLAGYFRNKHPKDITTVLLMDFAAKCRPPLDEATVKKCVDSAYSYEAPEESKTSLVPLNAQLVREICDRGWLRSYIDWASSYTDAPLAFHLATGLSLLATAMGNRVSTRAWGRSLYPNLWIVIVSPTGFYRKTTAIRSGIRILKRELGEVIISSEWSREKLVSLLANNPAGLFEWDEFGFALASMQKDYMLGSKEMLTKLFDSSDTHTRTTGSGGQSGVIENPAPNILGGTTLEWLRTKVKEGDLRGGFMARFLFLPGAEKEAEKDFDTAFAPYTEEELSNWLKLLSGVKMEVDFSDVKKEIRDWVRQHEQYAENVAPEAIGFISRGETYLLKLSMVLASGLDNKGIVVTPDVVDKAGRLLDAIRGSVLETISAMTLTREGKDLEKLRDLLKRKSPIRPNDLLKLSNWEARKFHLILDTLRQTGEVIEVSENVPGGTKKRLIWKG